MMADGGPDVGSHHDLDGVPVAAPTGLTWPEREPLPGHHVGLARPRLADVATTAAMQADPRLWVDVPTSHRTTTPQAQADDFRRFLAHWRRHGFGYWVVWSVSEPSMGRSAAPVLPLGLGGLQWLHWRGAWVLNTSIRLATEAQGRGLATAVLDLAVTRLDAHLDRPVDVVVRTRPGNAAMVALAARIGATDAGIEEREVGTYLVLLSTIGGRS